MHVTPPSRPRHTACAPFGAMSGHTDSGGVEGAIVAPAHLPRTPRNAGMDRSCVDRVSLEACRLTSVSASTNTLKLMTETAQRRSSLQEPFTAQPYERLRDAASAPPSRGLDRAATTVSLLARHPASGLAKSKVQPGVRSHLIAGCAVGHGHGLMEHVEMWSPRLAPPRRELH